LCSIHQSQRPLFRKLRNIPPSAQGADELHRGRELTRLQVGKRALVGEQRGLSGEHFEVAGGAALIALVGDVEGALRGRYGPRFDGGFLVENAQSGEIILHILKGLKMVFR